jgi:MSHA biogenesis protein MshO
LQLTLAADFDDHSPASRLYIARKTVSYCANTGGDIYRNEVNSFSGTPTFYSSGSLMAENMQNDLTESAQLPFRVIDASLTRNSLVQILLAFERNEEVINYSNEVHFPNVP